MIRLLEKLISQRDGIHSRYGTLLRYTQDYRKRLSIIRKVLVQEKELFEGRKVSDRIISIDRHYIHCCPRKTVKIFSILLILLVIDYVFVRGAF